MWTIVFIELHSRILYMQSIELVTQLFWLQGSKTP